MYYTNTNCKLPLVSILWKPIFWIKMRHYFQPDMGLKSRAILLLVTHLLPATKSIPNPQRFPQIIYLFSFSSVPSNSPLDNKFLKDKKRTTFWISLIQMRRKKQTTALPSYLLPTGGRVVLPKTNDFDSIPIHPANILSPLFYSWFSLVSAFIPSPWYTPMYVQLSSIPRGTFSQSPYRKNQR